MHGFISQLTECLKRNNYGCNSKVVVAISFVEHTAYLNEIIEVLLKYRIKDITILSLNQLIKPVSIPKAKFMNIGQVVANCDYDQIDDKAINLAANWYFSENLKDNTVFNGISLGSLVQREMTYLFSGVLKAIADVKVISERIKSDIFLFLEVPNTSSKSILLGQSESMYYKIAKIYLNNTRTFVEKITIPLKKNYNPAILKSKFKEFVESLLAFIPFYPVKAKIMFSTFAFLGENFAEDFLKGKELSIALLTEQISAKDYLKNLFNSKIKYNCLKQINNSESKKSFKKARYNFYGKYKDFLSKDFIEKKSLLIQALDDKLHYVFNTRFPQLAKNISAVENYLTAMKIKTVVVPVDVCEYEKTIVSVANKLGIPSIVIQHGVSGHPIAYLPFSASKIALWGDVTRQWLLSKGVSSDKLELTGTPRFDIYMNKSGISRSKDRELFLEELKLDKNCKTILFVTQPTDSNFFPNYHWSFNELMSALTSTIDAVRDIPGVQVIVKLKPGDPYNANIKEILEKYRSENLKIVERINLCDLIFSIDCMVTGWSTMALEAMIVGRPVICVKIDKKGGEALQNYIDSKAVLAVDNLDALKSDIEAVMNDADLRKRLIENGFKYADKYLFKRDGNSGLRVKESILRLAGIQ